MVALGSNLRGQYRSSQALLEAALGRLPDVGLHLLKPSRWWRSAAWPEGAGPDYLNGVALVETPLSARETLDRLLELEVRFGRERGPANGPRTLDLDLIAHGRTIAGGPELILPHPEAHLRRFVMGPLAEIAPAWMHPSLAETAATLATQATIGADAAPADAEFGAPGPGRATCSG